MEKGLDTLERALCNIIANYHPFTLREVERTYEKLRSYDKTIEVLLKASVLNISPNEVLKIELKIDDKITKKIYCAECIFYRPAFKLGIFSNRNKRCIFSDNKKVEKIDDYYSKRTISIGYFRCPSIINKNNDCGWFKTIKE